MILFIGALLFIGGAILAVAAMHATRLQDQPLHCCACGWRQGTGHASGCFGQYGYWVPPHRVR
jgi:hypothetical protein